MIRGRGLWKGRSPLSVTSATAVCRLSRELDFLRPSEGPTSLVEPDGRIQRFVLQEHEQINQNYDEEDDDDDEDDDGRVNDLISINIIH